MSTNQKKPHEVVIEIEKRCKPSQSISVEEHHQINDRLSSVNKNVQPRLEKRPLIDKIGKKNIKRSNAIVGLIKRFKSKTLQFTQTQIIFNIIEWSFFIILCIIAGLFTKDVIKQFRAKTTIMAQSLKNITELPTIVFCTERQYWNFSDVNTVNILYSVKPSDDKRKNLIEKEPAHFKYTDETVMFEQINHFCFKLNGTIGSTFKKGLRRKIVIDFPKNVSYYDKPKHIKAYFTSEENYNGLFFEEWLDGEVFWQELQLDWLVLVTLEPIEYNYLNQLNQCSAETFLEQWKKGTFLEADLSNCSKKCAPHLFLVSEDLGVHVCPWDFEHIYNATCVGNALLGQTFMKQRSVSRRPCHILEYSGESLYEGEKLDSDDFKLEYSFAPPEMTLEYNEHLLFDIYGLIVYVGGILGMCISFSFIGVISTTLDFIKSRISN